MYLIKYFWSFVICLLLTFLTLETSGSNSVQETQTAAFLTVGNFNFTVPNDVTKLNVTLNGPSGGSGINGAVIALSGVGGMISGSLEVNPGEILMVFVGGTGTPGPTLGGFNGGGRSCVANGNTNYGSGGGATDIRRAPFGLEDRLGVAGGGGGAYFSNGLGVGGDGGYPNGTMGLAAVASAVAGGGGTQTAGGTAGTSGSPGSFGVGGGCDPAGGSGAAGGGGGYYGGGSTRFAGAGGGSSYFAGVVVSNGLAARGGGSAVLSWIGSAPTSQPSGQPSSQPSVQPSTLPSAQPSAAPTGEPSAQPSAQPTIQPLSAPSEVPSVQPSTQPSALPTTTPSAAPSATPSIQPSSLPSVQPSARPSAQPSSLPSVVPSAQPSTQPTSQPSSQPSVVPSAPPTVQPVSIPSGQPSRQPSSQPTTAPSTQPSRQPSSRPSVQPSTVPSTQPSSQPTRQPTAQPSIRPSTQPSVQPSAQPSAAPSLAAAARQWSVVYSNTTLLNVVSSVGGSVWACGQSAGGSGGSGGSGGITSSVQCVVVDGRTGNTQSVSFNLNSVTSIQYIASTQRVLVSGKITNNNVVSSVMMYCTTTTPLACASTSIQGIVLVDGTYNTFANSAVYIGKYGSSAAVVITDTTLTTPRIYTYSSTVSTTTNSITTSSSVYITLSSLSSISNFVGSFVVGTSGGIGSSSVSVASINIFVGWILVNSGVLNGMLIIPSTGTITNSVVTAVAMEPTLADSFVVGGMVWSGDSTSVVHAYVLRANALFHTVQFCVRYLPVVSGGRRLLRGTLDTTGANNNNISSTSVARSLALIGNVLYIAVDHTTTTSITTSTTTTNTNITNLAVLKINANNGALMAQSSIRVTNGSLFCTDITATSSAITIVCSAQLYALNTQSTRRTYDIQSVLLTTDTDLSFSRLPVGYTHSTAAIFYASSLAITTSDITINSRATTATTTTTSPSPSYRPTTLPTPRPSTRRPSIQPSSAPSAQPSSSPTAAPSVSAHPTSQPSSAVPTVTHKPSVTPTHKPSMTPSAVPTVRPTIAPSILSTLSPTLLPSVVRSTEPTVHPTVPPTRTFRPLIVRTQRPSVDAGDSGTDDSSSSVSSSGGSKQQAPAYTTALAVGGCIVLIFAAAFVVHRRIKYAPKDDNKIDVTHPKTNKITDNGVTNHSGKGNSAFKVVPLVKSNVPPLIVEKDVVIDSNKNSDNSSEAGDSVVISSMDSDDWSYMYDTYVDTSAHSMHSIHTSSDDSEDSEDSSSSESGESSECSEDSNGDEDEG